MHLDIARKWSMTTTSTTNEHKRIKTLTWSYHIVQRTATKLFYRKWCVVSFRLADFTWSDKTIIDVHERLYARCTYSMHELEHVAHTNRFACICRNWFTSIHLNDFAVTLAHSSREYTCLHCIPTCGNWMPKILTSRSAKASEDFLRDYLPMYLKSNLLLVRYIR